MTADLRESLQHDASGPRVLVLDASRVGCAVLEDALHSAGYRTAAIQSPAQLAEAVESFCPSVMLLDFDALDADRPLLEQLPVKTKTLAILSCESLEASLQAFEAGAIDCIYKPFEKVEILTRVHRALQPRSLARPVAAAADRDEGVAQPSLESIVASLEAGYRNRLATELREPLRQIVQLAQRMPAGADTSSHQATAIAVLRTFLSAIRRLAAAGVPDGATPTGQVGTTARADDPETPPRRPHLLAERAGVTPVAMSFRDSHR